MLLDENCDRDFNYIYLVYQWVTPTFRPNKDNGVTKIKLGNLEKIQGY